VILIRKKLLTLDNVGISDTTAVMDLKVLYSTNGREYKYFVNDTTPVEDNCLICFEHTSATENVACHQCGKFFHLPCMKKWFDCEDYANDSTTCPHCKVDWKFEIEVVEPVISSLRLSRIEHVQISANHSEFVIPATRGEYLTEQSIVPQFDHAPRHILPRDETAIYAINYNVFRIMSEMSGMGGRS